MAATTTIFSQLDDTGRFHRDSPLGRIFHPGTVSYREISSHDSLHIAVAAENRVSVHVDRISPLAVDDPAAARYSFARVLHHNVAHCRDALRRLWRRQPGDHRCELDCEIVTVADETEPEAPSLYEFSCQAAGAEGCGWKARATSEEELIAMVAEHARRVHHVALFSTTLSNYARREARPVA